MPTITKDIIDVSTADATTGWSGTSGQADSEAFKQGTAAYTYQTGKNTLANCTFTPSANINMSNNYITPHLYWTMRCDVFPFCELLNTGATNSGLMVRITDGSGNYTQWHVAGKDTWDGSWKNFILDLTNSANVHSTSGILSLADVDIITWYTDNSNSGTIRIIDNTWIDAVRYGDGLIANSTTTEAVSFQDIADDDLLTANYYGVLQEADGVLFCQGKLSLGKAGETTNFVSTGETLYFLNRIISSAHYSITGVAGVATDVSITGLVCKTVGSSGAEVVFTNIDSLEIVGSTFIDMGSISLYGNATTDAIVDSTTFNSCALTTFNQYADVDDCNWLLCDSVIQSGATMDGCLFKNITASTSLLSDNPGLVAGSIFESNGSNHAIEINTVGTYNLTGHTFTSYAAVDGSTGNEAIYNNTGGLVTLNASGVIGVISIRNGAGATTVVNNNTQMTFSGMKDESEVRVYKASDGSEVAGIEIATAGTTDDRTFVWSAAAGLVVDYVIHNWNGIAPFYQTLRKNNYTIPSVDTTVEIAQLIDRNAA